MNESSSKTRNHKRSRTFGEQIKVDMLVYKIYRRGLCIACLKGEMQRS